MAGTWNDSGITWDSSSWTWDGTDLAPDVDPLLPITVELAANAVAVSLSTGAPATVDVNDGRVAAEVERTDVAVQHQAG